MMNAEYEKTTNINNRINKKYRRIHEKTITRHSNTVRKGVNR